MKRNAFLQFARNLHLYSGVFLAPALLFFAITGGLQTFSLHETTRGSSYKPPAILVTLAQLHKKQTIVVPVRKPRPEEKPAAQAPAPSPTAPAPAVTAPAVTASPVVVTRVHNLLPMKIFFVLVSLGLVSSTLTGLYMSYKYLRNRLLVTAILVSGAVLPALLLLF